MGLHSKICSSGKVTQAFTFFGKKENMELFKFLFPFIQNIILESFSKKAYFVANTWLTIFVSYLLTDTNVQQ